MNKKKKPDLLTIIIYAVIVIAILYLAAGLGASLDLSKNDGGEVDFTAFGDQFEKTLTNTGVIFGQLKNTKSTAFSLTVFAAFAIGIYALMKYTSRKRLHRKGVEHGSARWATEKEEKKLADADKKGKPNKPTTIKGFGSEEFYTDNNILLTQEVHMSLNTRQHRENLNVLTIGGSGSGKSRFYLALLSMLVGKRNFAAIDLKNLEERFATNQMLNKRLAGCADMSFMQISELKMFKKLTGGDAITFEAKGKDAISATYNGCLVFCSNAKPNFGGDKGDHVYRRILAVPCNNVIPVEQRDPDICSKMFAEREAIINTAIGYLRRFIARGCKFEEPQVCQSFREEYKLENDNVLMFIEECTKPRDEVDHDAITARKEFYDIYRKWAVDNGFTPLNRVNFAQRLKAAGVTEQRLGHSGTRCYDIELTAAVVERYTEWVKNKS